MSRLLTIVASPWRRRVLLGAAALAAFAWRWERGASEPARNASRAPSSATAPARAISSAAPANPLDDESALIAHLRAALAREDSIECALDSLRELLALDAERALRIGALIARNADERYAFLSALLPAWADRDPIGAWHWAVTHNREGSEGGQPALTELVLARVASTAPPLITAILFAGGPPGASFVDQGIVALQQAHRREEGCALLAAWANLRTDDPNSRAPFERVAFSLAKDSPAGAAEWLLSLPASRDRDAGLGVIASVWAASDPSAAIAWAQSLASGDARELAIERAFAGWVERDGESALRWLVDHESDPEADHLIARWLAVSEQVRAHPGAVQAWLALIRDPALRAQSAGILSSQ